MERRHLRVVERRLRFWLIPASMSEMSKCPTDAWKSPASWIRLHKTGSCCSHRDESLLKGQNCLQHGDPKTVKTEVKQFNMGGRSVYACSKRQRLDSKRAPLSDNKALPTRQRRSGTKHLGRSVSAVEAENKKRKTGEGPVAGSVGDGSKGDWVGGVASVYCPISHPILTVWESKTIFYKVFRGISVQKVVFGLPGYIFDGTSPRAKGLYTKDHRMCSSVDHVPHGEAWQFNTSR